MIIPLGILHPARHLHDQGLQVHRGCSGRMNYRPYSASAWPSTGCPMRPQGIAPEWQIRGALSGPHLGEPIESGPDRDMVVIISWPAGNA